MWIHSLAEVLLIALIPGALIGWLWALGRISRDR